MNQPARAECPVCNRPYARRVEWQRYCSIRCKNAAYYQRHKVTLKKEFKPKVKRVPPFVGYCEWSPCQAALFSWHKNRRYCCAAHKQAVYRQYKRLAERTYISFDASGKLIREVIE